MPRCWRISWFLHHGPSVFILSGSFRTKKSAKRWWSSLGNKMFKRGFVVKISTLICSKFLLSNLHLKNRGCSHPSKCDISSPGKIPYVHLTSSWGCDEFRYPSSETMVFDLEGSKWSHDTDRISPASTRTLEIRCLDGRQNGETHCGNFWLEGRKVAVVDGERAVWDKYHPSEIWLPNKVGGT